MEQIFFAYRNAVVDPASYNLTLWSQESFEYIQGMVSKNLFEKYDIRMTVPLEQIKNVVDSFSQANPRMSTQEARQAIINYIVHQIKSEETPAPKYDSTVLKYDGTFGIQQLPTGQLGIKKKGLNRIGRMF
jgi:hypothetical protein